MRYEVIILGCGPVGVTLANLLGASGFSVAVVDQAYAIFDKPRAITLDHEALRIWQACGLGDELAARIAPHPGTDYLGVDGQVIKVFDPLPPPYPLGWYPTAVFIQPDLEALLRASLTRYERVETLLGWEATGLRQDGSGVALSLRHRASGDTQQLEGRYLLGCDGASSFTRKALNIAQEDLAFDEWWLVVDTKLRHPTALPEKCVQYCWPSRPATFIAGPQNLRRWEIKLLPGERPQDFTGEARIRELLSPFVDPSAIELWRAAVYRFHALVATRWRAGRIFLLGDAAHQMPPFLGQGLCSGLRDAGNLAWKLDHVEHRRASSVLLDSYEEERKPHIRAMVATTKAFGRIIGELDEAAARHRDAELSAQLRDGRAPTIRQRYIPDLEGGVIDHDAQGVPARPAGTLSVQPRVHTVEGERLLDDLVDASFLIVTEALEVPHWLDSEAAEVWRRLGGRVIVVRPADAAGTDSGSADVITVTACDGLLRQWMTEHACRAVVVRPDRSVFGVARDAAGLNRLVKAVAKRLFDTPA